MIHFIFLLSEVLPGERFTETEEIRLMGRNLKSKNLLDPCIVLACKNIIFWHCLVTLSKVYSLSYRMFDTIKYR